MSSLGDKFQSRANGHTRSVKEKLITAVLDATDKIRDMLVKAGPDPLGFDVSAAMVSLQTTPPPSGNAKEVALRLFDISEHVEVLYLHFLSRANVGRGWRVSGGVEKAAYTAIKAVYEYRETQKSVSGAGKWMYSNLIHFFDQILSPLWRARVDGLLGAGQAEGLAIGPNRGQPCAGQRDG
jgi:hypothetical protein